MLVDIDSENNWIRDSFIWMKGNSMLKIAKSFTDESLKFEYMIVGDVAFIYWIVCWLIKRKATVETPDIWNKMKYAKQNFFFLRRLLLGVLLTKTVRVNQIVMKSFTNLSFGVGVATHLTNEHT